MTPPKAPAPAETAQPKLPQLAPRARFKLPGEHVRAYNNPIQLSADGTRVALGTRAPEGKSLTQVWQLGDEPKLVAASPRWFTAGVCALSPSGKYVAVAVYPPAVFAVGTEKPLVEFSNLSGFSHAFFTDEDTLVCTSRSHDFSKPVKAKVTVWNVTKNADAGSFEVPDDRFETALPAKSGKELWLFLTPGRREVECYDIATKQLKRSIKPDLEDPKQVQNFIGSDLAAAPDGSVFAATPSLARRVYDIQTGKVVGGLPKNVFGVPCDLVPGGTRCVGRTYDVSAAGKVLGNSLVLCDWKAKTGLVALSGSSPGQTEHLAGGSADGKTLVTVSKQGEVLVYDVSGVK